MDDGNRVTTSPPGEDGVVRMHEPIYRELAEPRDGHEPTPMWLVFLAMALLGWGGWYLGTYSGGFNSEVYLEDVGRAAAAGPAASPTPVDPMVLGRRVFNNCMPCHQKDGEGVAATYPPLAGSEWVASPPEVVARLVLHGLQGPITVRGEQYSNDMPAWQHLPDDQLAAVLTYVRASFGNQAAAVSPAEVAQARKDTAGRASPWKADELAALRTQLARSQPPAAATAR